MEARRSVPHAFALAAWAIACVLPAAAQAEGLPVALHWTRAPGAEQCIGPTELAQRIEARLGRAVFEPAGTAEFALEGHIQPLADGGFTVLLALNDAAGQQLGVRELSSLTRECRSLDDAITLVIAVTLYPERGLAGAGIALPEDVASLLGQALDRLERAAPAPASPTATSAPPPAPRPPRPPPRRDGLLLAKSSDPTASWRFSLRGAGAGVLGTTPNAVMGAHVSVGLVPPHMPAFEASAAFASEDQTAISGDGSKGTLFVATSRYGLAACTRWDGQATFETSGCAGIEALLTQARSDGLRFPGSATVLAPAPFVSARGALWLGEGFGLELAAHAGVPLNRAQLQFLTNLGKVQDAYQVSALYAEATLGLTWISGSD
ncbi:MAG TPA: hypothetical protein VK509_09180 [Polyangiales bacterium]|nr:hypothetical protein [Polyangiales bacterium]